MLSCCDYLNPILHEERDHFCPPFGFYRYESLQTKSYLIETILKPNFITTVSWNYKADKVRESYPILRFAEVTFRNLSIFGQWRHKTFLWGK